jgi:hypothetical protein
VKSTRSIIKMRTGSVLTALAATLLFLIAAGPAHGQSTPTEPMKNIVPVHFAANGDITIGSKTYVATSPFHLLALRRQPDRNSLDAPDMLVDHSTSDPTDVLNTLSGIETNYPDAMLMVNSPGNYGFLLWQVGYKLVDFGATTEVGAQNTIPFAFIGIGGRVQGTPLLQRGGRTATVDGYLAPDSNGNYTFIQTDFVRYDIQLNGDITVGATTYTVAGSYKPLCTGNASGSFHVVVVDRETLALAANNTYCTSQSDGEIGRIIGDLNTLTSGFTNEAALVFIASDGKPIPANWNFGTDGDARLYPLAQQIRALGGYWETMVYLTPNDTFSLVGASRPPTGIKGAQKRAREASSVYPEISAGVRPSGELHGVLARTGGRGNFYSPLNADLSGYANLGFYEALGQPSAPFPTPNPMVAAEVSAFQTINTNLCGSGCNVRNLYDSTSLNLDTLTNKLTNMTDQNGVSCGATTGTAPDPNFCKVRTQLLKEFTYVGNIILFYKNLQTLWLGANGLTILSQLDAYNTVKQQLPVPPTAPSQSLTSPLVNFFLGLASFIPDIGPVFGLADIAFNFGTSLTTDQQGNKTIDLTSTIGNLETQAIAQFTAQAATTGTLFQLVFQDWAKLSNLGVAIASQQDQSSPWFWSTSATGEILNQLTPIIQQASYQNIMAAAYAIGFYLPNSDDGSGWVWGKFPLSRQSHGYEVEVNRSCACTPISHPFDIPAYIPFTYPGDPGNLWADDPRTKTLLTDGGWLGISGLGTPVNGTTDDFQYQPPSEPLQTLLFNPVWKQGLGVYRPAFFNSWPFPRLTCVPSFGNQSNGGTSVGGCYWNTAAPAPEQIPGGKTVTDLMIGAIQTSPQTTPRPAQIEVLLSVANNGTLTAETISIDSITPRTLSGVGAVTLAGPALPIQFTKLRPGDVTTAFVKLNVPQGVTRFSLTEQGTQTSLGTSPQPTVFRFNEAQTLIVQ